jgi:hypothetical protein
MENSKLENELKGTIYFEQKSRYYKHKNKGRTGRSPSQDSYRSGECYKNTLYTFFTHLPFHIG